jgi:hypothetical protein
MDFAERLLKPRVIDLHLSQDLLCVGTADDCKFLLSLHLQSLFRRFLGGHDLDHEQVVGASAMGQNAKNS